MSDMTEPGKFAMPGHPFSQGSPPGVNGEREFTVKTNESTFIPAGNKHRLSNTTTADLAIIEVQSGGYLGEDDIVRFEDVYGRAPAQA